MSKGKGKAAALNGVNEALKGFTAEGIRQAVDGAQSFSFANGCNMVKYSLIALSEPQLATVKLDALPLAVQDGTEEEINKFVQFCHKNLIAEAILTQKYSASSSGFKAKPGKRQYKTGTNGWIPAPNGGCSMVNATLVNDTFTVTITEGKKVVKKRKADKTEGEKEEDEREGEGEGEEKEEEEEEEEEGEGEREREREREREEATTAATAATTAVTVGYAVVSGRRNAFKLEVRNSEIADAQGLLIGTAGKGVFATSDITQLASIPFVHGRITEQPDYGQHGKSEMRIIQVANGVFMDCFLQRCVVL